MQKDDRILYSFNKDETKIRANYGHTIQVDLELETATPPEYLYHGSSEPCVTGISRNGLQPISRQYVHMSTDIEDSIRVSSKYEKPVVYRIDTKVAISLGAVIQTPNRKIWLTKHVPAQALQIVDDEVE